MIDRRLRAFSLLVLGLLTAGIVLAWYDGKLFPWLHVFVYVSVMLVVLTLGFDIDGLVRYYWSLCVLCVIGVAFRVPMVLLPGTLSGNDPEKYALFARLTILSDRYFLPGLDFYGTAGAFHTYIAQTAAISGIAPEDAMAVIGLFIGLWVPLIAASFCLSVLGRSAPGYQAAILAAAVATVATISVRMSYVPFAQSLGTILLVTLLLVAIKQIDVNRPALSIVIVILAVAMALSHKLPLVVATPVVGAIWFATRVSASSYVPWVRTERYLSFRIVAALAVATVIQQFVITSFITDAIAIAVSTLSGSPIPTRVGIHPGAAAVPNTGLLRLFGSHSHAPVTLLLAGLSWLLVAWTLVLKTDRPRATAIAFLAAIASLVMLVVVTLGAAVIPEGVDPFRTYALVEPLLAGVIGMGLVIARNRTRYTRVLVVLLLVFVVVFNGFSASAAPDYPGEERGYLTPEEMSAKRFAVDHVPGEVFTDGRYARQTPYPGRVTEKTNQWIRLGAPPDTRFEGINDELINGTAVSAGHPTLMIRTGAEVYGAKGSFRNYRYRLTWDVAGAADRRYHRVYDNRDVVIYRNATV